MIPSIDSYLHEEVASKLKIILSNRYIIEEILKNVQPAVRRNFIRKYADRAEDIPIMYTLPQEKVQQKGAIYIGLREGQESHPSIGNMEDTYDFKEQGTQKDASSIQYDEESNRLYLEVEQDIGELINVEGIQFAASDEVKTEGNRVYFKYDPFLQDTEDVFRVNYVPYLSDETGIKYGFTSTESYSVLCISTNMDTVRCLDLIIKSILILMRNNPQEHTAHLLQRIQFGQIQEIEVGTEATPELLYGRESIVTYTVSYNLDAPLVNTLEEIIVQVKQKEEGK